MSPPTKNLKEKIEESLSNRGIHPVALQQITEIHLRLLSSELSLAIKGLREAMTLEHECDQMAAFDAKAKEILGESS